jgi:hypothetical protein
MHYANNVTVHYGGMSDGPRTTPGYIPVPAPHHPKIFLGPSQRVGPRSFPRVTSQVLPIGASQAHPVAGPSQDAVGMVWGPSQEGNQWPSQAHPQGSHPRSFPQVHPRPIPWQALPRMLRGWCGALPRQGTSGLPRPIPNGCIPGPSPLGTTCVHPCRAISVARDRASNAG